MIFHEIYSVYYQTVAKILTRASEGALSEGEILSLIEQNAFSESTLSILPALKGGRWQLMRQDYSTPIRHTPKAPVTLLERRWLKSILLDPRVRLFPDACQLAIEDVEPLFMPEDYCVFDRYADGDPYTDAGYIQRFRTVLSAVKRKQPLKVEMTNRQGKTVFFKCLPVKLEYSEKDDKFRVYVSGNRYISVVNLARIIGCAPMTEGEFIPEAARHQQQTQTVTLEITDERNALERVLLHFAHFCKQAERAEGNKYLLRIEYDASDESELVIRTLSFGPAVRAVAPAQFVSLVAERLKKQREMLFLP
ncbi:MAG: WYL domain-containing protein [Clostridia bacterium]|nr:WYL domain-containing protein [Clostridia bacterium]